MKKWFDVKIYIILYTVDDVQDHFSQIVGYAKHDATHFSLAAVLLFY